MSMDSHRHAAEHAIGFARHSIAAEPILGQGDEPLGFNYDGVNFWTCGPRVYTIAQQTINEYDWANLFDDLGLEPAADQFTGRDAENVMENGARLCYLSHGEGRSHEDNIRHLRKVGHNSVFRHATLTIAIAFVSRGFTHELVRHAAGTAYSQVSSRYVDASKLGVVIPEIFMENSVLLGRFIDATTRAFESYRNAFDVVHDQFLRHGETGVTAKKLARGACREMLPIGAGQVLQMTLNADAARHILAMRGSPAAETQIRKFAVELAYICKAQWPILMEDVEIDREKVTVTVLGKEQF